MLQITKQLKMFQDLFVNIPFDSSILKQKWCIKKIDNQFETGTIQDEFFTGYKFCLLNQTLALSLFHKNQIVPDSYFLIIYSDLVEIWKFKSNQMEKIGFQTSTYTFLYVEDSHVKNVFPDYYFIQAKPKDLIRKSEMEILPLENKNYYYIHHYTKDVFKKLNHL